MSLKHVRDTYEAFGASDPFFAVLSRKGKEGGGWTPDEFYATGVEEIADVMRYLERADFDVARNDALDFGAGAGRLTQALGDHFERVVGVDISSTMLQTAEAHNRHGERVRYVQNTVPNLVQFETGTFDFIYSNITLQHMPSQAAEAFIGEFLRLLRPGGLALFQVPDGRHFPAGSIRERVTEFVRGPLRRLTKRLRGKPPVEIHYVARPRVEAILAARGGTLLDVYDVAEGKKRWPLARYCVRKD